MIHNPFGCSNGSSGKASPVERMMHYFDSIIITAVIYQMCTRYFVNALTVNRQFVRFLIQRPSVIFFIVFQNVICQCDGSAAWFIFLIYMMCFFKPGIIWLFGH